MKTKLDQLNALQSVVSRCTKCKLHTTRTQTVFGEGNFDAHLMFIGEGPGKDEDLKGRPFIGKAGELLTRLIEKGMKLQRSDVYIANIAKCRPTENLEGKKDRPPDSKETAACGGYLLEQIEIIQPKVIVTLGNPATRFLLKTTLGITVMRGKWSSYKNIPVMPTYHPSYLLRYGSDKNSLRKEIWSDLCMVLEKLGLPIQTEIKWKE